MVMMMIKTRTKLATLMIFILLFWIILMMVSEVDGEGGDGLTPEASSADIFLVRSKWQIPTKFRTFRLILITLTQTS